MFLSDRKNMYALVAFNDGKKIVPIESIRNFNPKNFNKKKKYNVLWDEDGMYYDGVILCVKGNFRLLSAFNYHVFFVYMCISMYFQKLNACCQIPKKKSRPKRTIEGYPFLTLHFVNQPQWLRWSTEVSKHNQSTSVRSNRRGYQKENLSCRRMNYQPSGKFLIKLCYPITKQTFRNVTVS